MWTIAFWKSAVERAVKTFAQTFLAVVGADQMDISQIDTAATLSIALGAAILSLLTSLGSAKLTDGDPSLV